MLSFHVPVESRTIWDRSCFGRDQWTSCSVGILSLYLQRLWATKDWLGSVGVFMCRMCQCFPFKYWCYYSRFSCWYSIGNISKLLRKGWSKLQLNYSNFLIWNSSRTKRPGSYYSTLFDAFYKALPSLLSQEWNCKFCCLSSYQWHISFSFST